MRIRDWAASFLLLPVRSCASCLLQGGTGQNVARACLSAAVVGAQDPCPGRLSCAHMAQPQLRPLRCVAAGRPSVALPDGSEGLGLLAWAGALEVLEIEHAASRRVGSAGAIFGSLSM